MKLRDARQVGAVGDYRLTLSNRSPEDKRIRVCVQGRGGSEAHFWCGPEVELDQSYFGFDQSAIETIREFLVEKATDIRRAWQRFSRKAKEAQEMWLTRLLRLEGGES